jgi:hypothetical protein
MNYGEILEKAWKIIWRFKVLWIFGLLASCGAGGGGGSGGGGSSSQSDFQNGGSNFLPPEIANRFEQLGQQLESWAETPGFWMTVALITLGFILFIFLLSLLFTAIRSLGLIGLVRGTWQADEGAQRLPFGELLKGSFPYLGRVFLFLLLLGLAGLLLGIIIAVPLVVVAVLTLGIGILCLLPLLCLLIPIGMLVSTFEQQVIVAMVGEDLGILDGVKRAWNLMRDNLGPVAVMTLILFVGGAMVGVVLALPILIVAMPAVIGIVAGQGAVLTGGLILSGVLLLVYILVATVLGSILHAYIGSAWTLTFRRLTGREAALEMVVA